MNVLWLGFSVPENLANYLFSVDPLPSVQTHKFGWSFVRALRIAFGKVILVSACPVQNFPLVSRIIFHGGSFSAYGINGVMIGFVNILLLKHFTRLMTCIITVLPLIKRENINWIFIHGLHSPYLVFGLLTRLFGCRMAVVMTDSPGVMLATDGWLVRMMKIIDTWFIKKVLRHADAVFALAPDLVRRMAPGRPELVFPGILESTIETHFCTVEPTSVSSVTRPFTIVYAGSLNQSYGVDLLIQAVQSLSPRVSVCLKLFGRGDQELRIRQLASKDSRIIYGGFLDTATLIPELCAADILINPRPTREIFATQSFPSKLIEYLATGRPVLTTRITSIPDALKEHFYYIEDETAEGINLAICAVMKVSALDRTKHGYGAQLFVQSNYSEAAFGQRIFEFINSLNFKVERSN